MKLLSLFTGIGAFEKALKNIGINYELIGFSEIDKYAIKSYCAIHNENEEKNLGDITKIDITKLPKNIDIITHGSPCQDFSLAGKQAGGDLGTGTRSSLMWNTINIVTYCKPKYIIWENVKNLLSKKHRHNFDSYLSIIESLGYNNYHQVLNAKDFGIPQNRERIYVVSVRNDITNWFFFPDKEPLEKSIKDFLDVDVPQKYYLSPRMLNYCMDDKEDTNYPRRERFLSNINRKNQNIANTISTNAGNRPVDNFIKMKNGKVTFEHYPIAFRGRYDENGNLHQNMEINKDGVFNTLTTFTKDNCLLSNEDGEIKIRKLTPRECWKLMGFTSDDFDKASKVNSNTQLYKQAGNSIVVNVLEKIFKNLFFL